MVSQRSRGYYVCCWDEEAVNCNNQEGKNLAGSSSNNYPSKNKKGQNVTSQSLIVWARTIWTWREKSGYGTQRKK